MEDVGKNSLNMGQYVSEVKRKALGQLPYFKYVGTPQLIREATAKLRGMRLIQDRDTAMLVIAGTRYLTHPELQVSRKA